MFPFLVSQIVSSTSVPFPSCCFVSPSPLPLAIDSVLAVFLLHRQEIGKSRAGKREQTLATLNSLLCQHWAQWYLIAFTTRKTPPTRSSRTVNGGSELRSSFKLDKSPCCHARISLWSCIYTYTHDHRVSWILRYIQAYPTRANLVSPHSPHAQWPRLVWANADLFGRGWI